MNAVEFRRQLVAVAIAEGKDLGAAVAAAKDVDGWCQAADPAAPAPRLALPAPSHFARRSRDEREALEAAVPVQAKPGRPKKRNARRLEAVAGAARQPRRVSPAGAAPSSSRKSVASQAQESRHAAKRVERDRLLMRALAGAGAEGLSGKAARTAIGCSQPTCDTLLKAARDEGRVERIGPKVGMNVRWRLVATAKKSDGAGVGKPRRSSAGTVSAGADTPPRAAPSEPAPGADVPRVSGGADGEGRGGNGVAARTEGANFRRSDASPVSPANGWAARPAAPASLPRLPKVEADVLAALARAPDEGFDLATLVAKTGYAGSAVQTAVTALRADRAVHCPRPGKFALAGVHA